MSDHILIIDAVATNRIVLKVKMLAAHYRVTACASQVEAWRDIKTNRPDLILVNLSDQIEDRAEFCKALKSEIDTSDIAVIAVGVSDTSKARLAALDAGADDVLPRPVNDTLLLARIRSLLRVRSAGRELLLRDGTSRALGFSEECSTFQTAAEVALLCSNPNRAQVAAGSLTAGLGRPVRVLDPVRVLQEASVTPVPDLFVIDATLGMSRRTDLFGLVSDLRSRTETRLSAQLVILPPGKPDLAAMFLDLGADDVVSAEACSGELTLRARALCRRKSRYDRLRQTVRTGLRAAVTDPLTGLYNRRYVETHLARMAEQSHGADRKLAVMMLDIDHFKAINDTYGHATGDAVLVQLATRLRDNLRAVDLVARVGGEEFLVAMPRTTAAQAQGAAERLRRLVNAVAFDVGEAQPPLRVTVSVGVAVSDKDIVDASMPSQMYLQADAALYAAKNAGRDTVAVSRPAG